MCNMELPYWALTALRVMYLVPAVLLPEIPTPCTRNASLTTYLHSFPPEGDSGTWLGLLSSLIGTGVSGGTEDISLLATVPAALSLLLQFAQHLSAEWVLFFVASGILLWSLIAVGSVCLALAIVRWVWSWMHQLIHATFFPAPNLLPPTHASASYLHRRTLVDSNHVPLALSDAAQAMSSAVTANNPPSSTRSRRPKIKRVHLSPS